MNESTFRKHIGKFMKCVDKKELTSREETQQYLTRLLFMQKRTTTNSSTNSIIASPTSSSNDAYLTADPEELVRYLCSLAPRQVCQYQFKSNDIVWICKQCQKVSCYDMMMIEMMMMMMMMKGMMATVFMYGRSLYYRPTIVLFITYICTYICMHVCMIPYMYVRTRHV